jgi:hypothetical protein
MNRLRSETFDKMAEITRSFEHSSLKLDQSHNDPDYLLKRKEMNEDVDLFLNLAVKHKDYSDNQDKQVLRKLKVYINNKIYYRFTI